MEQLDRRHASRGARRDQGLQPAEDFQGQSGGSALEPRSDPTEGRGSRPWAAMAPCGAGQAGLPVAASGPSPFPARCRSSACRPLPRAVASALAPVSVLLRPVFLARNERACHDEGRLLKWSRLTTSRSINQNSKSHAAVHLPARLAADRRRGERVRLFGPRSMTTSWKPARTTSAVRRDLFLQQIHEQREEAYPRHARHEQRCTHYQSPDRSGARYAPQNWRGKMALAYSRVFTMCQQVIIGARRYPTTPHDGGTW